MVRYETLAVLAVFILSLAQMYAVIVSTEDLATSPLVHAKAASSDGSASLCVNRRTTINLSDCLTSINQSTEVLNYTHICFIEGVHPANHSILFFAESVNHPGLNLSVTESGIMTIWADQSGVGNHSVRIYAEDIFQCPFLNEKSFEFEILDINDPPFLSANIPSFNIPVNVEIAALNLNDYFDDPDNDPLYYQAMGASNFEVRIRQDSLVSFFVTDDFCGVETIYFTATDITDLPPHNYTVDSNMVSLNAVCPTPPETPVTGGAPTPPSRCTPEWKCERWSRCYPNETQYRRCIDMNGCDPLNLEKIFWQECEYIPDPEPDEDELVVEEEEEEVEVFVPERERPVLVDEVSRGFVGAIMVVLISLAVLLFIYVLFRKEILGAYARLSWWLTRKARKEYLLSDDEKEELLGLVSDAERSLSLDTSSSEFKSSSKVVRDVAAAQRVYLMYVFDVRYEFTDRDVERVSEKKIVHDSLRNVLKSLFKKLSYLERSKVFISRRHVSLLIEELRQLVLNTSKYDKDDYAFVVKETPVVGSPLDKCVALLYNAMIALQFREYAAAEEKYISLLKFYEELPEEKKSLVYDDVSRLYHNIKYVISWA